MVGWWWACAPANQGQVVWMLLGPWMGVPAVQGEQGQG